MQARGLRYDDCYLVAVEPVRWTTQLAHYSSRGTSDSSPRTMRS